MDFLVRFVKRTHFGEKHHDELIEGRFKNMTVKEAKRSLQELLEAKRKHLTNRQEIFVAEFLRIEKVEFTDLERKKAVHG